MHLQAVTMTLQPWQNKHQTIQNFHFCPKTLTCTCKCNVFSVWNGLPSLQLRQCQKLLHARGCRWLRLISLRYSALYDKHSTNVLLIFLLSPWIHTVCVNVKNAASASSSADQWGLFSGGKFQPFSRVCCRVLGLVEITRKVCNSCLYRLMSLGNHSVCLTVVEGWKNALPGKMMLPHH